MLCHISKPRQDTSYSPHCLCYVIKRESDVATSFCQEFTFKGILACYPTNTADSNNVSLTFIHTAKSGNWDINVMILNLLSYLLTQTFTPTPTPSLSLSLFLSFFPSLDPCIPTTLRQSPLFNYYYLVLSYKNA